MFLSRYDYRRRQARFTPLLYVGCGTAALGLCAALFVVALLILPNPQAFVLQVLGFRSAGQTEAAFANQVVRSTPVLNQAAPVSQIVLSLPQIGQQTIIPDGERLQIDAGVDAVTAQQTLRAQTDEAGLLALCQQYSALCGEGDGQVRGVRFDLRPNGLIVYAEVFVSGLNVWQPVGIVFQQVVGQRLGVIGVDVGGMLLVNPPAPYSELITQAEEAINQLIGSLGATAAGTAYTLQEIYLDDDQLTLILR